MHIEIDFKVSRGEFDVNYIGRYFYVYADNHCIFSTTSYATMIKLASCLQLAADKYLDESKRRDKAVETLIGGSLI